MAAPTVPGYSNVIIDAKAFTDAALAYGDQFDLWAGQEIERVMNQIGEIVQRAVRKRAKRHYRTGRLERNVRITGAGAGWNRRVQVRSGGHSAHLVAGNVRAHEIHSRQPRTPAMPLYVAGHVVGFSEAVKHPATKGDPYFHVGVMNSRLAINAVLKASAKKLVQHLADISKGP
jgi:hypothetical protein